MSDAPSYPFAAAPGVTDTSMEAGRSIAMSVGRLQRVALHAIRDAGSRGLTTHELAVAARVDRESIQPRTSELRCMGLIKDSGERRANVNGKNAIVWIAVSNEAEVCHD